MKNTKIEYEVGNAEKIPFNKKFDLILYANAWHFIKDFSKALKEARRVLKAKGIIVILDPSENTKNWASSKLRENSLEFDKKLYENKLKDLERGKKNLFNQKIFEIIEQEYDSKTTSNFYILRKRRV